MERFYSFAGITIRITGDDTIMYNDDGILTSYSVSPGAYDHTVSFEIVDHLPLPAGKCVYESAAMRVYADGDSRIYYCGSLENGVEGAYLRGERKGNMSKVQGTKQWAPERISPRMVLGRLEAEYHIAAHGGFLLHASFIRWKDGAILFTAPSQTGKSTQAELWCSLRGAEQINGDRAAVMVSQNDVRAWGLPFCGSSGISKNVNLPLKAIVYLSQAKKTSIQRLTGLRAFSRVWEGCSVHVWEREDLQRCTDAVIQAVEQVPVFHLSCTPDETAVAALERALLEMR